MRPEYNLNMFKICFLSLSSSLNIWKDILASLHSTKKKKPSEVKDDKVIKLASLGK